MGSFLQIELDGQCLQKAAAGDRQAQRQVYDAAAAPVFALIRGMVPGRAAAEDVFQDCMVTLLARLGDYRGEAPFGAWTRQVAVRQCLMHLRSPWQRARRALDSMLRANEAGTAPESADGFDVVAAGAWAGDGGLADRIDLERALARLPDLARAIVWMHDVEGLTHEEIAATFGRTSSFSKSQLSRAHALLRAGLDAGPVRAAAPGPAVAVQEQLP